MNGRAEGNYMDLTKSTATGRFTWPPSEPPWTVDLPRAYGHRPPWNTMPQMAAQDPGGAVQVYVDDDGRVINRTKEFTRHYALTCQRRCHLCGCTVDGGCFTIWHDGTKPNYGSSDYGDAGYFTTAAPVPMHRSCALYAAMVCPLLHSPHGKFAEHRVLEGWSGPRRGAGYIVEARHYGLLGTERLVWDVVQRPYKTGRELAEEYHEAIATEQVDVSTRLYWPNDSDLLTVRPWVIAKLKSQWPPLMVLA